MFRMGKAKDAVPLVPAFRDFAPFGLSRLDNPY
jgi:hypothetical protein